MPSSLPLTPIVNVSVTISPLAVASPSFNVGLVGGNSGVIPSIGTNPRVRSYTALSQMLTDGFSTNSPEYLAGQLYFGQTPAPTTLQVGCQDPTALQTVTIGGAAGTGYVSGDIVTVTQAGASMGKVKITTVSSGVPTAVQVFTDSNGNNGTGYSVATSLPTTGGTGTGLTISITAIGETVLQAITACRLASPSWYAAMWCGSVTADHELVAAWAQAAYPATVYVADTSDTAVLYGTAGNLLATLQGAGYNRTMTAYSTTQGGTYPNNAYAAAAAIGVAMGLNTGLPGSFFTMKFKRLIGVAAEPLSQTQVIAIEALNGNLTLNYAGGSYTFYEQGNMANGQFFDEILNIDLLTADIQFSCTNVFQDTPAVPMTNAGQQLLINAVAGACQRAKTRGWIGSGTWTGSTVLNLTSGMALDNGFLIQSPSYATQSAGDRAARKAMPIYVCLIEAQAAHSLTIGITVQR